MNKITKAVFPVAGLGTRFLPATKANPKEMLPVVDKPLIQYAVEEATNAGLKDLIFISGRNKRAISDHFDKAYELEAELEKSGKKHLLEAARSMNTGEQAYVYLRQPEPLGLGHAVLCSRPVVGDEAFAVLLADDLIDSDQHGEGVVAQMVTAYKETGCSILAVQQVPRSETYMYGIVEVGEPNGSLELMNIKSIIEKPHPEEAPSTWAVVGRYLLTPAIFDKLEHIERGAGGEIQLTDGIAALLNDEPVYALPFKGRRYDCGNKLGYLEANLAYASKHPELGTAFRKLVKQFVTKLD